MYLVHLIIRLPSYHLFVTVGMLSGSVSLYYQNVRGLNSKTVTFFNPAASCDFDLIAIAET
jgi:hypothetical protein